MIKLVPVNEANYLNCIKLKVKKDQKEFVATNAISLAQAYVFPQRAKPFVIFNDEKAVGFMMFDIDLDKPEFYIWRFMIDAKYQSNGYGSKALLEAIIYLKSIGAKRITLSHVKGNEKTSQFYLNAGFKYTGDICDGELVMEYIAD